MENTQKIAELLNIKSSQVQKVLELTAEGNTVPFIARYRKEVTGSLDEVEIKKLLMKTTA
jgi:Transcriptional accessory protein